MFSTNSSLLQQTLSQGRLFVVSGPSGVGKGTMLSRLYDRVSAIEPSISATTRDPRPGEVDGVNYYFVTQEAFENDIEKDFFLEYALYGPNYYGTPLLPLEEKISLNTDVLLEIEVQGARLVRRKRPDAILIYIQPPTMDELERRLRGRRTETEESIAKRLEIAQGEQAAILEYDYLITNDDLETSTEQLIGIVLAERCRIRPDERKPE